MRITHLRQADLNLLVVFSVLAEERSASRSAKRLALSQPAVSRALQRLRATFHDDLLVRTAEGYEPTPRGQRLLQELAVILPRLDRLLKGVEFNPGEEQATFRVSGTDNAAHVLCPALCKSMLPWADKVSLRMVGWHDGVFEDLERGRLDLSLNADDGHTPERFLRQIIYEDDFVCVVAKESRHARRITLDDYVKGLHVGIDTLGGRQTIPEQRLAALDRGRRCAVEVPYFTAAMRCVAGTELIATVPRRMAAREPDDPAVKIVEAPAELGSFRYLMVWHARVNSDAAHAWLRSLVREAGNALAAEPARAAPARPARPEQRRPRRRSR
ncbi:LysR family transcriptional regulator [Sorangium sp. So ce1099]|uniref:LysR family transcriptional regulator n=1 Tax=Sorangium sp. So ce1099 TaxID=3133331 RepID=UPI003F60BFC8